MTKPNPTVWKTWVWLAVLTAFFALIAATTLGLVLGGGAAPQQLIDPGLVVRLGLPMARGIGDFAMAIAIGSLVLACFATADSSWQLRRATGLAAAAAVVWTLAALLVVLFTYLSVTGSAFSGDQKFGSGLWLFVTQVELGQYLALNLLGGALVANLALMVERLIPTAFVAALAMLSLVPLALSGHAAGSANHAMAVNSIGLHLVGVSIWVGGLVALVVLRSEEPGSNTKLVARYSSLALFAFALVAVSGAASALVRLHTPADLASNYGRLVVLKVVALVALGLLGAWYRARLIGKMADNSVYWRDRTTARTPGNRAAGQFWTLVGAEVALMAFAVGIAAALGRTAPPDSGVDLSNPTPAQILTGEPLPIELTPIRWFTAYKIDLLWLVIGVVGISAYLIGVWRMHKRGDKWPVVRTLAWLGGMLLLLYITNGSMNVYEQYLFSVHMIAHMMLTMAVPTLLVMGAPVTLLMRAVAKRNDDTRGVREWVLWLVHTPYARFISHPIVAAINFASSLVVFYFTPLFSFSMREHVGHEWMVVHFVITGYLFVQALVGIDPGPPKVGYPIRLMILIGTLTFHAFFGLALMQGDGLILADWFGAMGRTWGELPLADQKTGGAIAWGVGELPSAVLTLIVSVQWARSDTRESRRLDRASDRTGNQDIDEYNQMLARLAEREQRRN